MNSTETLFSLLGILVTSSVLYLWRRRSRTLPLPPGPKGYPLVGNVYDIPHDYAWLTYTEWQESYGEIIGLNIFGRATIILNSLNANALPSFLWQNTNRVLKLSYPLYKSWRMNSRTGTGTLLTCHILIGGGATEEAFINISNLVTYPLTTILTERWRSTFSSKSYYLQSNSPLTSDNSIVLRAAYGYEVQPENDFYITLAHKAVHPLLQLVHAGTYLVEYLPALKHIPKWFPGAGFKRKAESLAVGARNLRDLPFEALKQSIADGVTEQSYAYDNLEKLQANDTMNPEEEEIIKNCAAIMYLASAAGSDTVSGKLHYLDKRNVPPCWGL